MFRHTDDMQFDVKPEKPDPVYARKLRGAPATDATANALGDPDMT